MQQVVEQFPGTRHSANANHKLHEWKQQEEEEYIRSMQAGQTSPEGEPEGQA